MSTVNRSAAGESPRTPQTSGALSAEPAVGPVARAADHLTLSGKAHGPDAGQAPDRIEGLAHTTHTPHGVMHAVEAGEQAVHAVSRFGRQVGRVASVAAEVEGEVHHLAGHGGIFARLEQGVVTCCHRAMALAEAGLRALPGGSRVADRARDTARAAGTALDASVAGTRLAGSGGRFLGQMGGRLPVVGAAIGGVIAVADVRGAVRVFADPDATPRDRAVAGSQASLSVVSGAAGVLAIGVAAAAALGLALPLSVPFLLSVSALAGVGAFALSFLTPKAH